MANESFKELMQCIEEETDTRIKELNGIRQDFLKYESWINELSENFPEEELYPKLEKGSLLYINFPFHSYRESLGINVKILLRLMCDGNVYASYDDTTQMVMFPSKSKLYRDKAKLLCSNLIKYFDLIESESMTKEDIGYSLKTFKDVKSLIIYLKTIKDSIKDDNYAALKVYFENERTERLLREITDC